MFITLVIKHCYKTMDIYLGKKLSFFLKKRLELLPGLNLYFFFPREAE